MSPVSLESYDFLADFRNFLAILGRNVTFTPKYRFKNMVGVYDPQVLETMCIDGGKFCVAERSKYNPLAMIEEGIRQTCIWQFSQEQSLPSNFWWDYVLLYAHCLRSIDSSYSSQTIISCEQKIYLELNFSDDQISLTELCVKDSYETQDTPKMQTKNTILESTIGDAYAGVYIVPALLVNSDLVKESLSINQAIGAICSRFLRKGDFCISFQTKKFKWNSGQSISQKDTFILILVLCVLGILILAIVVYVIKRSVNESINEEVNSQIRNHVTDYMKLKENSLIKS